MTDLDDAYDQMDAAISNLVRASREANPDDGLPNSVISGWVLSLDNRGFDEDGEATGYVSAITPNDGQPPYISKMILKEAHGIYKMHERRYGGIAGE